jgi:hypothetical protein
MSMYIYMYIHMYMYTPAAAKRPCASVHPWFGCELPCVAFTVPKCGPCSGAPSCDLCISMLSTCDTANKESLQGTPSISRQSA